MFWEILAQAYPGDLPPPTPKQVEKWQEGYEVLIEMQNELKIWEMVINFLSSGDFLLIILTVFVGVTLVKSVKVVDRYLNETKKDDDGT